MNISIYKQGQGHWTRLMTFMGGMVMFAWGAAWLAGQMKKIEFARDASGAYTIEPQFVQGGTALTLIILGAAVCYWLTYAKPSSCEFLIATEGEMKKVNWSSKKELMGSTWVVVGVAMILATSLFFVDLAFSRFFQMIHVLNPTN